VQTKKVTDCCFSGLKQSYGRRDVPSPRSVLLGIRDRRSEESLRDPNSFCSLSHQNHLNPPCSSYLAPHPLSSVASPYLPSLPCPPVSAALGVMPPFQQAASSFFQQPSGSSAAGIHSRNRQGFLHAGHGANAGHMTSVIQLNPAYGQVQTPVFFLTPTNHNTSALNDLTNPASNSASFFSNQ